MNSFTPAGKRVYQANEEIFCDGEVKYYNQPIGAIVAESQQIADRAAKLVTATYSNVRKPVIDVVLAKKDPMRNMLFAAHNATDRGSDVFKVIVGSTTVYQQYHFCMETLTSITVPVEEALDVYAATQFSEGLQLMTSRALNIEENK